MKTQLTVKTQMSVLAQTGANQVLTRIPTSEVETARRAVCGRLGEATLPKADLRLAPTWNGRHSTGPARRIWKQTLPALLGCILLSMPMAATAQEYDGFEFTTNADGISVTITGYYYGSQEVNIPSTIDGLSVTEIGTNAFESAYIASVTIPGSVTAIGSGAFEYCYLTYATISLGVTDIGSNAFYGSSLTSVTIPASVTNIGSGAFECDLTTATISLGVTDIGSNAFAGAGLTSVTIPASVTNIGSGAFEDCRGLTNATISLGVTDIGFNAFAATGLTSVTIPESVTNLGAGVFEGCSALTAINVASNNPAYTSIGGVLFNRTQTTLLEFSGNLGGSYIIPDNVTNIGAYAFYDCGLLTNATIGSGVISIGDYAFAGTGMFSLTIPNSVTNIGDDAFYGCVGLTNVAIPDSVTEIGAGAFEYCALTSVTIPNSLTSIGEGAFVACPLTAIAVEPNNPAYVSVDGVLFNQNQTALIQFPAGNRATSYTIPSSVTSIANYAFLGCTNLTGVTIPGTVNTIGDYAFYDCSALTNVTIGSGVISIGNYAFSGYFHYYGPVQGGGPSGVMCLACPLTSVTIPNSVISIGDYAFNYCALTNVTIGNSVTNIANYAFSACPLMNITIPNSVMSIGDYAFYDCSDLTNVTIGDGVISIGNYAFSGTSFLYVNSTVEYFACPLTSVTIPNSVTTIGNYAFYGCSALTNVTIGGGVTSIGNYAFSGELYRWCPLTSVTIPNSVTNIGDYAFSACPLTNVYFTGNAPTADATVFPDNPTIVYYLPGTTGWGSTFGGCPTALWTLPYPVILNSTPNFGVQSNGFSFNISWATNLSVVVEASTDLANPVWQTLQTNTLTATPAGGAFQFSDPQWTNYPARFYRINVP